MADVDPIDRGEEAAPDAAPVPKTKKAWLLPVLLTLGALVVGGGAYFAGRLTAHTGGDAADSEEVAADAGAAEHGASSKAKKASADKGGKKAKGAKEAKRTPIFYAMEPAFVVNYQDLQALHFLQVGVQVMAYEQASLDALKANEPLARNALVMLFSGQTYDTLISREGKEKLREEALQELRKVLGETSGKETLQAVYFTSFVMQ